MALLVREEHNCQFQGELVNDSSLYKFVISCDLHAPIEVTAKQSHVAAHPCGSPLPGAPQKTCGAAFATQQLLDEHRATFHQFRVLHCRYRCGRYGADKGNLRKHEAGCRSRPTPADEKRCDKCGYKTTRQDNMVRHERQCRGITRRRSPRKGRAAPLQPSAQLPLPPLQVLPPAPAQPFVPIQQPALEPVDEEGAFLGDQLLQYLAQPEGVPALREDAYAGHTDQLTIDPALLQVGAPDTESLLTSPLVGDQLAESTSWESNLYDVTREIEDFERWWEQQATLAQPIPDLFTRYGQQL